MWLMSAQTETLSRDAALRLPGLTGWPGRLLRAVLIALVAALSGFAGLIAAIQITSGMDETRPADAVLLLGAGVTAQGKASPALLARINHAAWLYHSGLAPIIAVTGGAVVGPVPEAEVARDLLLARGLPTEAILYESTSRSTAENVAYIAPLLAEHGVESVLLVTSPFHLWRARAITEAAGLTVLLSPAPDDPAETRPWMRAWYVLREGGAWILFTLFGW